MILYIFIGIILATAGVTLTVKGFNDLFNVKLQDICTALLKAAVKWVLGILMASAGFYVINYAML